VPSTIHYQGNVAVNGQAATGDYDFKFAIVDGGTENVETAQATATISGGFVTVLTVTDPGNGYLDRPAVTITGGGGSGAAAEAVVENGQVTGFSIARTGSGYTSIPEVEVEAPPSATIASLWSNDGSSSDGTMPTGAVSLTVYDGIFSVVLGDDSLANMTPLPAAETLEDPAFLRVWFDDGNGFQQLTPDQPLTAVPFAMKAASANSAVAADFAIEAAAVTSSASGGFALFPTPEGGAVLETSGEPTMRVGVRDDFFGSLAGPTIIMGSSANEAQTPSILRGAVIAGGGLSDFPNIVSGHFATISGGLDNTANKFYSTVGGGRGNTADGEASTVGGGERNTANGGASTVGSGLDNAASGDYSTVGGGQGNTASGYDSSVSGGSNNVASGWQSTVPGGRENEAEGDYSFAAGRRALALQDGTFVWADSDSEYFGSTAANQFLIRASGGVGINTNSPATALHLGDLNSSTSAPDGIRLENSFERVWDIHLSTNFLRFNTHESGGTSDNVAYVSATDGSWNTASDRRLKENITKLSPALDDVLKIETVRYDFKNREATPEGHIGLIAQDVHSLFPELVTTGETEDDFWGVNYAGFSVIAIKAIQEQQKTIRSQGERIAELEAQLNEQEALARRVKRLEAALLENDAAFAANQQ
jgi:hypothetical protein